MVVELGDIQLCGTRSLLSGIYFGMIEGEVGEYVKSQVESTDAFHEGTTRPLL